MNRIWRFWRDDRGAVAVLFGLSAMALMFASALAIDMSRTTSLLSKAQSGLDAASLAGAKLLDAEGMNDQEIRLTAERYFQERIADIHSSAATFAQFDAQADRTASSVTTSVRINVPSIFGRLAGSNGLLTYTPQSTSVYRVQKIELALVLDVTGSMAPSGKMDSLKQAAISLLDALRVDGGGVGSGLVKVSLVPYSGSVNAGIYSASAAHTPNPDNCVIERDGPEAYTDAAPTGSNRVDSFSEVTAAMQPLYSCPPDTILPLTDISVPSARSDLDQRINALTPIGGTAGHIGTAWGWYTISPQWASFWPGNSAPKPAGANVIKAIVLMTDGDFNLAYRSGGENAVWPSPDATNRSFVGSSPYQAEQLCNAIKAQGIRIYSVAFMAPPNAEQLLRDCADGSGGGYFESSTASELNAAFQEIAARLTSMRLSG